MSRYNWRSSRYPLAQGWGIDINPTAVRLADENAKLHNLAERPLNPVVDHEFVWKAKWSFMVLYIVIYPQYMIIYGYFRGKMIMNHRQQFWVWWC